MLPHAHGLTCEDVTRRFRCRLAQSGVLHNVPYFYETTPEGRRYRKSTSVGTVVQYPTKSDALRVIEPLRIRLNLYHRFGRPVSIGALKDHYIKHELPERRHSTQQSHSSNLNRWIRPRWGDSLLEQVKPLTVEEWLRSLYLAPKTKVNL